MSDISSAPTRYQCIPEYVTAQEAALITGFSVKALEALRSKRTGPAYSKVGTAVRYRVADLRAWLESHRVETTPDLPRQEACQ